MKQLLLKTILLCFAIICTNCSDNTEQPTGEDSFSFFINGDLYIPKAGNGIGGGDIRPFSWYYSNFNNSKPYVFNIKGNGDYNVSLFLINPKLGENILDKKLIHSFDTSNSGMIIKNETIFYNTKENQNNGIVTFTELSETKAIGTFECALYNEKNNELKVTKGRFNLSQETSRN